MCVIFEVNCVLLFEVGVSCFEVEGVLSFEVDCVVSFDFDCLLSFRLIVSYLCGYHNPTNKITFRRIIFLVKIDVLRCH